MCGICGILSRNGPAHPDALRAAAMSMTDTLVHRGPDDGHVWSDATAGLALGHRRLSILDLSAAGRQPMESPSGRHIIAYNGEIYNFRELRRELEGLGHSFRGHSDTEVLLAAIGQWDVERALRRANGMFAFALWDRERRTLTLARDRLGKKPLYYGWCGQTFLFGSELKSLRAHPDFDEQIDPDALGLLIQYQWIPSPYSIYRRVRKLPAGTLLTLRSDTPTEQLEPTPYWTARDVAEQAERAPFDGTHAEAVEELDGLLRDAVKRRMIADVPLGALLSGGVDSTTVVALMQAQTQRPVKTFAIGFHDAKYNEAENAKAIADYLGTEHTELYVTPEDSLELIPSLSSLYDEPFADPSQMPTFIVSRLARSQVTVALSGDGGDELFGGYPRYAETPAEWRRLHTYPLALRSGVRTAARMLAKRSWNALGPREPNGAGRLPKWQRYPAKLERKTEHLTARSLLDLFARMQVSCEQASEYVIGARPVPTTLTDPGRWPNLGQSQKAMMYLDLMGYLPDDILVKVDRASMGVSLEMRNPLLDYRVVELALRLPLPIRMGTARGGKRILRDVLQRYVPRELTERPKKGFSVPISSWLRGPMRDWAEELLNEQRLRGQGFFHAKAVRRIWRQHLAGWRDHRDMLWSLLMFQTWYDEASLARRKPERLEARISNERS